MEAKKTSPWVYVGFGCLAVVLLGVVAIGAISFMGYRWAQQVASDLKDPVTREAKVKLALGSELLPDGYHAMMSMSVPYFMDMAMLSDKAPDDKGEIHGFEERGFIYFQVLNPSFNENEMRDYFEGKTDDPSALGRSGINMRIQSKEVLRRAVFETNGYSVLFLAQRGRLDLDHGQSGDGINAMMLVDCPQDARMRMAIWFGPDPDPEAPAESERLLGTPADDIAARAFMEHFNLCGSAASRENAARP